MFRLFTFAFVFEEPESPHDVTNEFIMDNRSIYKQNKAIKLS